MRKAAILKISLLAAILVCLIFTSCGTSVAPGTANSTPTPTVTLAPDSSSAPESNEAPAAEGPFFSQKAPEETPEIFAPGILSLDKRLEGRLAFSPDGKECFFTVFDSGYSNSRTLFTKLDGDKWTEQTKENFSLDHEIFEPFLSIDGKKLFFTSNGDFYSIERSNDGWSKPKKLPEPINSSATEYFYNETSSGTAYFCSTRVGGQGNLDIYRTKSDSADIFEVENLGKGINTVYAEGDPGISPDGKTLVFYSTRPGGKGGSDLYITFDDGQGGWTAPVHMGSDFNTYADEYNASFSSDGQYLFFARYGGGKGDVYWVSSKALDLFKNSQNK